MAVLNGTKSSESIIGTLDSDLISGLNGNDTLLGLGGEDTLNGGKGADYMDGGDGGDIYVVDNIGDIVRDSSGQDRIEASISYSLWFVPHIEHLFLTGKSAINGTGNASANTIAGNSAANKLYGGIGNDTLFGDAGNDTIDGGDNVDVMFGGAGNDAFFVDSTADAVDGSTGIDTVISSAPTYEILGDTENLTLIAGATPHPAVQNGKGNDLGNRIVGSGLNNLLDGQLGNDTLDGGGGNDTLSGDSGADVMIGGTGDDFYFLTDKGDRAQESITGAAGGTDAIFYGSSTPFVLGANLEIANIDIATLATGNALDNNITASFGVSVKLLGVGGNDTLEAFGSGNHTLDGGSGADLMAGFKGDDLFFVDNGSDTVVGSAGIDEIRTSLSVLQEFADVENYTFTGGAVSFSTDSSLADNRLAGTKFADFLSSNFGHDDFIGGGGNDTLFGGVGADFLDGGAGADSMTGGSDGDEYVVDNVRDTVNESTSGNSAIDIVRSSISFSLAAPTVSGDVEFLVLTGKGAINGTGNGQNNNIVGNAAANKLDGGAGADILNGDAGNDTLTIDAVDVVSGGAGVDTVIATESVNLSFAFDIENYILAKGAGAISIFTSDDGNKITGNESENAIMARGGNDTVDGGLGNDTINGGFGNDVITGGGGNDLIAGGPGVNRINVALGNDTVQTGVGGLDTRDIISGFDGNATGGQDFVSLTSLFDSLGIAPGDRLAHVQVSDKGSVVEIRVDTSTAPGGDGTFDLFVATLQTKDTITVGADVLV